MYKSNYKKHLLIVDDDERIRTLIKKYLEKNNYMISTAKNAEHSKKLMKIFKFDLLVIDVMMPGESGISLTKKIRKKETIPILLLTALSEVKERILGLESGADDYLVKPFEPRELVLRIQSIIKRYEIKSEEMLNKDINFGNISYNLKTKILSEGDEIINLTTNEVELLEILINNINKIVSREDIIKSFKIKNKFSENNLENRTIDVQITRLRQKIEIEPKTPRYLKTIRTKGYILNND
tara:strand:+ start:966 stop:1682 length:717 start_codon:yes stop_codon:yes gene_type:complete